MRTRSIIAAALLTAAALTGCAAQEKSARPQKIADSFDKTARLTFYGRSYTAELRRGSAGVWECEFSEPECIAGLKLTAEPDGCRMETGELSYFAESTVLPETGLMPMLTGALEDVIAGRDVSCTEGKGCTTEVGSTADQSFTAKVKDGEVISLEINGCLSAEFK